MTKYQYYKPSGIEWVGVIPEHWIVIKNKFILWEEKEEVGGNWEEYPLLSLTKKGVIYRDVESGKGKFPGSFENYKKVKPDDLIFCLYDIEETPRTIGLSKFSGMITGSYDIYRTNNIPEFIYYWYLTIDDCKGLKPYYTGLRNVVRPDTFFSLKICLPPVPEQQQIVDFLNIKTDKIDKLISYKERKIELLKEKKTSLINKVITRGLDPTLKMKDSGVKWIGEIPEHWDCKSLKYVVRCNEKVLNENTDPNYELNYIEISDVDSSGNINNLTSYQFKDCPSRCRRILTKGDVIVSTVRTYLKSIGYIKDDVTDLICSTGFCVLTPKEVIISPFLFYQVLTEFFISEVISNSYGVSYPSITSTELIKIKILLPSLNEQQQIVEYLDNQTKGIDDLISLEQKKIGLLIEYRQSLISEVITGKIDVRTNLN